MTQEAGTLYNFFRDYDAGQGRYRQFDPIGLRGGWNGYTYGDNSPLTKADPNGLQAIPLPGPGRLPLPIQSPGTGGSKGGYDPRTDTFKPGSTLIPIPNWLTDLIKSKSELEQCEQEAEDQLERDYAYCKALSATYGNDYRTRKACEENAFRKYVKRLQECKQQCK